MDIGTIAEATHGPESDLNRILTNAEKAKLFLRCHECQLGSYYDGQLSRMPRDQANLYVKIYSRIMHHIAKQLSENPVDFVTGGNKRDDCPYCVEKCPFYGSKNMEPTTEPI